MSITGPKSRINFRINACIGQDCAVRDQRCHECVKINGRYSEFVAPKIFLPKLNLGIIDKTKGDDLSKA